MDFRYVISFDCFKIRTKIFFLENLGMVSDFAYFQVPGTGSSGKSFDIPFSLVIHYKAK